MSFKHLLFCVAMMGCTTTELAESGRELAELEEAPSPETAPDPAPAPAPAPAPTEPTKGDKCDSNFSLNDCKGGKAGETECTFPDTTTGLCWSGGPKFPNGEWDCNVCKPKPPIVVVDDTAP